MAARLGDEFLKDPRLPTDRDDRTGDGDTHSNRVNDAGHRRSVRLQRKDDRRGSPSAGLGGKNRHRSDDQLDCHGATRHEISHPHTCKRKREFVRDWVSRVIG